MTRTGIVVEFMLASGAVTALWTPRDVQVITDAAYNHDNGPVQFSLFTVLLTGNGKWRPILQSA